MMVLNVGMTVRNDDDDDGDDDINDHGHHQLLKLMHMTNTLSDINYLKIYNNNDNVHHLKTTLFSEGLQVPGMSRDLHFWYSQPPDRVTPPWLTDQYKGKGQVKCKTVTMRKNKRAAHFVFIVL